MRGRTVKVRVNGINRLFRYVYLRFLRLRGTAEEVARGMALGVFIGMTPTMGVQMPIALFVAMLLKENKLAAILGVWISNPATAIPIYTFNFQLGKYILGTPALTMPNFSSLQEVMQLGHDFLLPLLLGCFISGMVSAAIAYVVTLQAYKFVRMEKEKISHWKEEKKRKKEEKAEDI